MAEKISYTAQQLAAIENRGGPLLVSAAAGSGKTKVLVERLMRYMLDGKTGIDDFLIITYTRAAAGELRTKIMSEISNFIAENPENRHMYRQIAMCSKAQISTIHSFCTDLLRENAQVLDISPDFRVADDDETVLLQREIMERLLDERYENIERNCDFEALANTMGAGRDDSRLVQTALETYNKLQAHPYKHQWLNEQISKTDYSGIEDIAQTEYGAILLDSYRQTAEYWLDKLKRTYDAMAGDNNIMKCYAESFTVPISQLEAFISACAIGWDEAKKFSALESPRPKSIKGYENIKAVRTQYNKSIRKLMSAFDCTSAELLSDMKSAAPPVKALLELVLDFDKAFSKEKRRRNIIDFSDQEHLAVKLLYDEETREITDIARHISERYTEIMIDEYQDVNAVQEMIFTAVSKGGQNVFMVGDVKQSIYRFRLADPTIFLEKYNSFKSYDNASDGEGRSVVLSSNFRSRKGILDAVNLVFRNIMSQQFGEMDYTEKQALYCGASYVESEEPEVEFDVLDMALQQDEDDDNDETDTKTELEADFTARRIKKLVDEKYQVQQPDGSMRTIKYSDIAILLRSTKDKAWQYAYALSRYGIPVAQDNAPDIFSTTEVSILISLLAVIDNPAQDIPLISVMSSPIYGFTSDELSSVRNTDKNIEFYNALKLKAETDEKCASFINQIDMFRQKAYDMPSDKFIWYLFGETGLLGIVGAMKGGQTRRDNLMALYEYARSYEADGYKGVFSFVLNLRKMMEMNREIPLKTVASSENAVSIMSIHKSKGLEFPVVILPDLTKRFNMSDSRAPLLVHSQLGIGAMFTDTQRRIRFPTAAHKAISHRISMESMAEEMRVLYVAMTRAKEKLIMIASYRDASKSIAKLLDYAHCPVEPEVLKANGNYAAWILLCTLTRPEFEPLRFGAAAVPQDTEGKAWHVELVGGCEQERNVECVTCVQTEAQPELTDEIRSRIETAEARQSVVQIPSKVTATELKGRYLDEETAQQAGSSLQPQSEKTYVFRRPDFISGKGQMTSAEKGTALHIVMQYIDFAECYSIAGIKNEINRMKEMRIITGQQAECVEPSVIRKFFASSLGKRIMLASDILREFKYSILAPANIVNSQWGQEQVLFQGVVDCCICEGNELTVIDFKTDNVSGENAKIRAEEYRPQLNAYAYALERITGKKVKQKYLYFFKAEKAYELK